MEIKNFNIILHLKDRLEIELTQLAKAIPMPEETLTSFTYLTHIASLQVKHSYWDQKVGYA